MKIVNLHEVNYIDIPAGICITITNHSYLHRLNKDPHNPYELAGYHGSSFCSFYIEGREMNKVKLILEREKFHVDFLETLKKECGIE